MTTLLSADEIKKQELDAATERANARIAEGENERQSKVQAKVNLERLEGENEALKQGDLKSRARALPDDQKQRFLDLVDKDRASAPKRMLKQVEEQAATAKQATLRREYEAELAALPSGVGKQFITLKSKYRKAGLNVY